MQEEWYAKYLTEENKWNTKMQGLKNHIVALEQDKHNIFQLSIQVVSCRNPTKVYAMYLHEQWIEFKM